MRAASASLVVLAGILGASRAAAEEPAAAGAPASPADETTQTTSARIPLSHDLRLDVGVTAALAALLVASRVTRSDVVSSSCTICDGSRQGKANAVDDWFRNGLRRDDGTAADTAGDILTYGIGPAMGLGLTYAAAAAENRADEAPLNGLLVLEASLAAITVNEAFGAFIRRERPDVHALNGDAKTAALMKTDSLESFPAGSTASIMAITASTATVATLRGYRLAPLVWIIGTTLGLTSTYLRIAADKQYFTDQVAGASIGLGVGVAIPILFHRPVGERPSAATRWLEGARFTSSAVPGGRIVGLGWSF